MKHTRKPEIRSGLAFFLTASLLFGNISAISADDFSSEISFESEDESSDSIQNSELSGNEITVENDTDPSADAESSSEKPADSTEDFSADNSTAVFSSGTSDDDQLDYILGRPMTQEEYETALQDVDVMVSNCIHAPTSYLEYFGNSHNVKDMLLAGDIIKILFPEDTQAFEEVMHQEKYYFGNLCVMRKSLFDAYCDWLFTIFFEMEKYIDVSSYDDYHKRIFGFLSEELLMVYITSKKLKIKEGHVGITAEKAETVEFKLAMVQLVRTGQFTEARKLFYDFLKLRPDVQLELSDIKNEIPDIELILFILEKEKEEGINGMYKVSHELPELIIHFRKTKTILTNYKKEGSLNDLAKQYLTCNYVSDVMKNIILLNMD